MPSSTITRTRVPSRQIAERKYQTTLGTYSYPGTASGAFSGNFQSPNAASSSFDYFHGLGYVVTVTFGIPGIYTYSHDYGAKVDWDFYVGGNVNYQYDVPFKASFPFPINVYPGQRIYLKPTFAWHTVGHDPSIQTSQDYNFSQKTSAWFDAPLDGLDALSIGFTQGPSKANLDLQIPVLPLIPSAHVNFDITVPPFNSGGGEYGGSYTKLGGTGTLKNSGGIVFGEGPTELRIGASPYSASVPAWKQGNELFELAATVLKLVPTPVTEAAGEALAIIKAAGEFELDTQVDGSIAREDIVYLKLSDNLPYVDVPSDCKEGTRWNFDLPVTVKYRISGTSFFFYPVGYTVTFQMRGMDHPEQLAHGDIGWVDAGSVLTDWSQERDGTFRIQGSVPVVNKSKCPPELAHGPIAALESAQPIPGKAQFTSAVPGIKLTVSKNVQRVIRKAVTMNLAKPAGGQPQAGQYTVILGLASKAAATTITQAFKKKKIDAFMVPVPGSNQMGVTLGTFADKTNADTLQEMLRAVFKIDSYVSAGIEKDAFKPVDKAVVQKLQ